ncbi:prolactin regulatory element-binding protein-like isoform X1 [Pomacea canaliculata]|uniref:prolactin regulatory element-binding protein-like isoform X1 n=1 Tax=Pomacea canaliculata TaxID=400727 RepID=UPI000D7292A3|nr:prolactin regulatory element-binding protein-like isoform X1 [Pomacea canaliculata]
MAPVKGFLARSDFPLYAVRALDCSHFLVAGGGGQAKTGVPNAIEIYELKQTEESVQASSICRHDAGSEAIMNCSSFYDGRNYIIACGQDEKCKIYSVRYKVVSPSKANSDGKSEGDIRKRKGGSDGDEVKSSLNDTKYLTFDVQLIQSVQTDFDKDGGFQKVVRFSLDHSFVATGGADGFLRVWKYPDMKKKFQVQAHKSDIDDLDISPAGDRIVTVSRDGTGMVWNVKDGQHHCDLLWPVKEAVHYRFRCCRYGLIEGKKDKFNLYTLSIPVKRSSKPDLCYISLWDSNSIQMKKTANTGTEVLSALAVSDDGIYLGVGTISGSVSVYISFSLQRLYHVKETHSIFVTGLEFLPMSEATRAIVGSQDFSMLSVSADNTIKIHHMPERTSIHVFWVLLGCIILIFLFFWTLAELGI